MLEVVLISIQSFNCL